MKVHWILKVMAFGASVMTLSWFFAGWRMVHQASTVGGWAALVGGTLSTLLLLGLQGFWIYVDEKLKGSLKKRIWIYERCYQYLQAGQVGQEAMSAAVCTPNIEGRVGKHE